MRPAPEDDARQQFDRMRSACGKKEVLNAFTIP
jgi:hypothetical protein